MSPLDPEIWAWFNGALERLHQKHPALSWDRLAALLLQMFINGEEAP